MHFYSKKTALSKYIFVRGKNFGTGPIIGVNSYVDEGGKANLRVLGQNLRVLDKCMCI